MRCVGIYNAEGTLRGELAYWIGARLGRAHCALCDITHGLLRERADWRDCRSRLPVAFETFHLDDAPPEAKALSPAPLVAAETAEGWRLLLDAEAIERCEASPERFLDALDAALRREGLAAG